MKTKTRIIVVSIIILLIVVGIIEAYVMWENAPTGYVDRDGYISLSRQCMYIGR